MLAAYRPLFRSREAAALFGASLIGRLAVGMLTVPLVLLIQHATGSFAIAGAAAAAGSVGVAVSAPVRGRLVDRLGARRALPPLVAVESAVLAALPLIARTHSGVALVGAAAVSGLAAPPLVAAMRLEWQRLLGRDDPRLDQAYALETVAQIGVFVAGPALAAAGIALAGAGVTLEITAALTAIGGLTFAGRSRCPPTTAPTRPRLGPVQLPGVRTLVLVTLLADACLGIVDVTVVATAQRHGHASAAGVLLAVFTASSAVGGAVYGARSYRTSPAVRLVVITGLAAATYPVLASAGSLPALAGALMLAGPPSAAQWATTSVVLDHVTPHGAGAEAFTWLSSANAAGVAVGSAVAGAVVERAGPAEAFLCGTVFAAGACVAALRRRTTLARH